MTIPEPHVVRSLMPEKHMERLRLHLENAYDQAEMSDDPEVRKALQWGGLALTGLRPQIDGFIEPIVKEVKRRWPAAQLKDEFSVFRRIVPRTYIYWHMDADGTGSWQADPLFNCWMPLEAVGFGDYPSLEVMVNSERRMREVGISPPGHRDDDWVERNFPAQDILCPRMRPGDALIFSHWLLHRTQPMDQLKGPRIGCELRFTLGEAPRAPSFWQRVFWR